VAPYVAVVGSGEAPAPEVDKLAGPSMSADEIGEVDAVLLSHDHHPDNLDVSGREYLPRAGQVLTTVAGAERSAATRSGSSRGRRRRSAA
jgi:L-ascorbate metabolism protein UlaG (beta-lactamase superfamily)